jgi:hypothetical protein
MKNRNWIKFTTETGLICGYCFDENKEVMIKVFSKLPKTFYYSACNEAGDYFDEIIKPTL